VAVSDLPDPIARVAVLDEPTRRRLYEYVSRSQAPVGRDEASEATGVARATAAFHLDRLVEEGLLDVVHRRISGRTGPGAGRPAKLYLRSSQEIEVSLPQRRYELMGEVLASALDGLDDGERPGREVAADKAREAGREIGRGAASPDPVAILDAQGFEPHVDDGVVRLGNCPFHHLARRHTDLVCGMNLHLVGGLLEELGNTGWTARLQPSPDHCCVVLESDHAQKS
jgi:predicted ArsR family transcriptional regulator